MMLRYIRIIPRLDIKGTNVVKGVHLEGLRIMGKPEDLARHYYSAGADELIYIDVVASLYGRNSLYDIITRTAKEIFIPLTVGGGLRNIEDMRKALISGADKVCINTAAVKNPDIISEGARKFGSSAIVVAIEAIRQPDGRCMAFTDNGREYTGLEVVEWARKAQKLGAGEILLTSVDRDGTGRGYDIELTRLISESVSIPVIASGGAGKPEDVYNVITEGNADAVSLASMLHYDFIEKRISKIEPAPLGRIKDYIVSRNISCRPAREEEFINA